MKSYYIKVGSYFVQSQNPLNEPLILTTDMNQATIFNKDQARELCQELGEQVTVVEKQIILSPIDIMAIGQ